MGREFAGVNYIKSFAEFVIDWKEEGFWYAVTGDNLHGWIKNGIHGLGTFVYEMADYSILLATTFTLFAMAGSKRCVKYLYWTGIGYITVKAVGSALL